MPILQEYIHAVLFILVLDVLKSFPLCIKRLLIVVEVPEHVEDEDEDEDEDDRSQRTFERMGYIPHIRRFINLANDLERVCRPDEACVSWLLRLEAKMQTLDFD
ncbi:hypothetical protein M422DRAFT_241375 [Sphaerobolus stellatus SS14]|nr:hypothetical protein M422DRAFT_241375 [Sphaerobolus stellatus SS14]